MTKGLQGFQVNQDLQDQKDLLVNMMMQSSFTGFDTHRLSSVTWVGWLHLFTRVQSSDGFYPFIVSQEKHISYEAQKEYMYGLQDYEYSVLGCRARWFVRIGWPRRATRTRRSARYSSYSIYIHISTRISYLGLSLRELSPKSAY